MGIKVSVDIGRLEQKLSKQNFERGLFAMSNQMLADMNKYVPFRRGTLRGTGQVVNNRQIVWNTKYAKAQFYGTNGRVIFRHYSNPPLPGKRWDLKAKGAHGGSWKRAFIKGAGL